MGRMRIISTTVPSLRLHAPCKAFACAQWGDRLSKFSSSRYVPSYSSSRGIAAGAAVRTDGWVEVDAKVDMRAIVELIDGIPEIMQTLRNLTEKVQIYDEELVYSVASGLKNGAGAGVDKINEILIDLDVLMRDRLKQTSLDSSERKLLSVLELLQDITPGPVKCDATKLEQGFGVFTKFIEDILTELQKQITTEITTGGKGLAEIHHNSELIMAVYDSLERLQDKMKGGFGGGICQLCQKLKDIIAKQNENINIISTVISLAQSLPNDVGILIKADGGLESITKDVIILQNIEESVNAGVGQLIQLVEALTKKTVTYFTTEHTYQMDFHATIKETMDSVATAHTVAQQVVTRYAQEAARAARNAARTGCRT